MKKYKALLLCLTVLLGLAACVPANSESPAPEPNVSDSPADDASSFKPHPSDPPPSESEPPASPPPTVYAEGLDARAVLAELNAFLGTQGITEEWAIFDDNYTCEDYDTLTVYRSSGVMNLKKIVVRCKQDNSLHYADLGLYSTIHPISNVRPDPDDADRLIISTQFEYFGGDYTFADFVGSLYYSLSAGEIVGSEHVFMPGTYGMTGNRDFQRFDTCRVKDDRATFTFKMVPGNEGNGYDGPAVHIASIGNSPYKTMTFDFWLVSDLPSGDILAQMQAMQGVSDVEATRIDDPVYGGIRLTVTAAEGYWVSAAFNSAGYADAFEDFSIFCVRSGG